MCKIMYTLKKADFKKKATETIPNEILFSLLSVLCLCVYARARVCVCMLMLVSCNQNRNLFTEHYGML